MGRIGKAGEGVRGSSGVTLGVRDRLGHSGKGGAGAEPHTGFNRPVYSPRARGLLSLSSLLRAPGQQKPSGSTPLGKALRKSP